MTQSLRERIELAVFGDINYDDSEHCEKCARNRKKRNSVIDQIISEILKTRPEKKEVIWGTGQMIGDKGIQHRIGNPPDQVHEKVGFNSALDLWTENIKK